MSPLIVCAKCSKSLTQGLLRKSGAQHLASDKRLKCGVYGALTGKHYKLVPEGNRERSIGHQLSVWNVGFVERIRLANAARPLMDVRKSTGFGIEVHFSILASGRITVGERQKEIGRPASGDQVGALIVGLMGRLQWIIGKG